MGLTLHHVGCLVEDTAAALRAHQATGLFDPTGASYTIAGQKVRVSFLPAGNGTFIEFVEPAPDNTFLRRLLGKGIGYYHVGYSCDNLEEAVERFIAAGAHEMTRFASEAFEGRQCVFLLTASNQMIELIESA